MSPKWKTGQYLEWRTSIPYKPCSIPTRNQPPLSRISPFFLLKGNECCFRFDYNFHNAACDLYFKSRSACNFGYYCVKFEVEFNNEEYVAPRFGTFLVSSEKHVWGIRPNTSTSKLPSNCTSNSIKFVFFFEGLTEPLLPKKKTESQDKCIQTSSYLNAVVPFESISTDFCNMLNAGVNYDAEIKCGKHAIKVHQIILIARSKVFKAMLESNILEGETGILEIHDMDINYLQDFIKYLYTGEVPELTFDKAKVFYEAGNKYAVYSLTLRCSEYLQDNLALENIFQCFALADAYSDPKLKDRVKTYILEEKMYLQDELWLPFIENYPRFAFEVYRLSHKRKISESEDL